MIAKLHGIIDSIGDDWCIIDVNGVGYFVSASAKTLGKLVVGQEASLLTIMTVREDDISLFGFADAWEKEWFGTLTRVQGVGAKVCLSILSVLTPTQIAQAIGAQDKVSFCRANGVGPKLAARIITELKDKIVTIPISGNSSELLNTDSGTPQIKSNADANYGITEDAISALINLGYQRLDAYLVVNKVAANNPKAQVADLIRLSLKEFARKD